MLRRKKRIPRSAVLAVQTGGEELPFEAVRKYVPLNSGELRLYRQLRESVPMIDAALDKLVRLVGKFHVECRDRRTQDQLNDSGGSRKCGNSCIFDNILKSAADLWKCGWGSSGAKRGTQSAV